MAIYGLLSDMNCVHSTRTPVSPVPRKRLSDFQQLLLAWYANNRRTFPWRKNSASMYNMIVSELLLQRTRAETVAKFFDTFVGHYPSWKRLAEANESEIGHIIQPIGLWKRRAPVLKKLAKEMVRRNGRFPKTREKLEDLPGIGQYIANAIMLLCHGEPQPLIDVNMARVLERVFGPRKLVDIRYDPHLQGLSQLVVKHRQSKKINWAILDLAAEVCVISKPRCNECPLTPICVTTSK